MQANLVDLFKKAGLECKVTTEPIVARRPILSSAAPVAAFELSIQRKFSGNSREEYFRIYPGSEKNNIQVLNVDKEYRQLVLMVQEPRGEFDFELDHSLARRLQRGKESIENVKKLSPNIQDIFKGSDGKWYQRIKISGRKMHYLMGVDERQLFIAQLPKGVSTVKQAHSVLKTTAVTLAEGRVPGKTYRQGEWFFCNIPEAKKREINEGIRKKRIIVKKNTPIGNRRGPKAHIAEQLITDHPAVLEHGFGVRPVETYVRGKIRHPDHATLKISEWRMVIKNNEPTHGGGATGTRWID